jgi:sugar lactone lactonase YvrE
MTIDSEGKLWIAHWGGWQLSRWDPLSGKKISSISLPVEKVTSCTFGGKHLRDLYITTAKIDLSENELKRQPLAGSLFIIKDCGFQGVPAEEFPI